MRMPLPDEMIPQDLDRVQVREHLVSLIPSRPANLSNFYGSLCLLEYSQSSGLIQQVRESELVL